MRKKAKAITGIVIAICVVAAGFYVWKYTDLLQKVTGKTNNDKVYVESVASVVSMYGSGTNRYMGIVEAQETVNVNAASDRTVKKILVSVGDEVAVGDKLFTYDTEEAQKQIEGYQLDLEKYDAQITAYHSQIKEIETQRDRAIEKKTAKDSDLLEYTTQIQAIQLSIQEVENSKKSTSLSIEKAQSQINNSVVTAKIDGTVKAVNDPNSQVADSYVDSSAGLIVIQTNGDYRVKGSINEQNVWTISEGQAVIVRSRVDDRSWTGTINEIKTEPESNDNNNFYSSDSGNQSTDYPFYIALDNADGLMLGQHLYIEMDYGQSEAKEGIWIGSGYLMLGEDASEAYVWVRNDKEKLEKRKVILGEYDEMMDIYEITEGLAMTDYITSNMDNLYEGVTCVTDLNEVDYSSPMYNSGEDSEYTEDGLYEDSMNEDIVYEDGVTEDLVYEDGQVEEELNEDLADEDTAQEELR